MNKIIRALGLALAATLALANPASATTLYSSNFGAGNSGFTGGANVGSQGYGAYGFGTNVYQAGATPAADASVSVNLGQAASGASLTLSLAVIDSWDGVGGFCCGPDAFTVKVDGNAVFTAVFDNYDQFGPNTNAGLSTLFYGKDVGFSGFQDAGYTLSLNLGALAAGNHTFEFIADGPGWQGTTDESFALSNVVLSGTTTPAVPEPANAAMLMLGLLGLGVAARRRAR